MTVTDPADALDAAVGLDALADLVLAGPGVVVLTGAGLSTDSGIPDYRGPGSVNRNPMTYQEFCSGPDAARRYWARSYVGWQRMGTAEPNDGHRALAELEGAGLVSTLITQNVDGLHRAAGSSRIVELHGRIDRVICLDCRAVSGRAALQARLDVANPDFVPDGEVRAAPDGDALLEHTADFVLVGCADCGGLLKPDVVFFGESVPPPVVARCFADVEAARALLVLGSSLTVHSGLRFVRRAHREGIPVAIVNRGTTRGDDLATVRVEAGCTPTLRHLAASVRAGR